MDSNILCTLLAQRISPEQFQLHGLGIHWMDETYNTPENETIAADVIANYGTLEATYLADELAEKEAKEALQTAKQQALVDTLPSAVQVKAAINNAFPDAKQNAFMTKFVRLVYLDLKNSVD